MREKEKDMLTLRYDMTKEVYRDPYNPKQIIAGLITYAAVPAERVGDRALETARATLGPPFDLQLGRRVGSKGKAK